MRRLLHLEIKKVLSKRDVMFLLGLLVIVPVLFSLCIIYKVAGINFTGQISIDSYGIMIWSFLKYLFVLYLVPIYIVCSFMGREIENRSINIMLSNKERSKVLGTKLITYVVLLTVFFMLFHMVSVVSYTIFIQGTDYAMSINSPMSEIIFLYVFQWLEMMFMVFASAFLCCLIKGNIVLILGLGIVILEKIFLHVESVKRILPYYISDYSSYCMLEKESLLSSNILSSFIYFVILAVLLLGMVGIWKKRDF